MLKHFHVTSHNNHVLIVGKTVVLKERAACSIRDGREVYYISLGACDERGKPLIIPLLFDFETEDEDQLKGIKVENTHTLCDCEEIGASSDDLDDIYLVINKYHQLSDANEINVDEWCQIMREHGVNEMNVERYLDYLKKGLTKHCKKDVFQHLLAFLRKHATNDIYIDEFPILQNKQSKIYTLF